MAKKKPNQPEVMPSSPRFLPVLLLLFVGSGCSALIYEIVWFQLLQLVIGSSAISLAVLLGTFMGGMCLGSLLLPRVIPPRRHPLRVYSLLELGIGIFALAVLFGMPLIGGIYTFGIGHGMPGLLLRGVICAACLLPPTMLMGATLPAISRWVETTPRGISWLGFFYAGNTAGAVLGCLLAGFYLLRVYDVATATYVAAAVNLLVGSVGLKLSGVTDYRYPEVIRKQVGADANASVRQTGALAVYVAIGLSGLSALGAEVVWTRLLSLLLGATVYTFSIILAVFLAGLGIGSSLGAYLSRRAQPRMALGWCQMALAAAIAWTAYMLTRSMPFWPVDPSLSSNPWFAFQIDLARCLWAVLPPALMWGASFPLALAAVAPRAGETGRAVGEVYAANTLGAIIGAIGFSMIVIPGIGTRGAQRLLISMPAVAALLMIVPLVWPSRAQKAAAAESRAPGAAIAVLAMLSVIACALLIRTVGSIPPGMVGYGRFFATYAYMPEFLYVGEGMNASIAVSELSNGVRNFHVSGKVEASTEPQDMRLQSMLGNLPALVHPNPRSVLVVGFGAGVTAGSFVPYPEISKIVICEIEPLIPQAVSRYFIHQNHRVLNDPRVEMVYDDARHYILTSSEKFDIITSDPIHPWVKGAATLYTKEYFELLKRHLKPGGMVTQWVPLYESDTQVVKSEMATFFEVFPEGTVWGNQNNGVGYDTVLLGQIEPAKINLSEISARLGREEYSLVNLSLYEAGFRSVVDLLATYAGRGRDLRIWLNGAEINYDRDLRLQYLAGMALNLRQGGFIYNEILSYRQVPEGLFEGSDEWKRTLREALGFPPQNGK